MKFSRPSPYTEGQQGKALLNRRDFLGSTATGLGAVALTHLLSRDALLAKEVPLIDPARPHLARDPHFPARAKNVLVLFCAGACSQLETWDYKPELFRRDASGPPLWRRRWEVASAA